MTRRLAVVAITAVFAVLAAPALASVHQSRNFNRTVEVKQQINTDVSARKRVRHVKRFKRQHRRYAHRAGSRARSVGLSGVVSPLAFKVQEIVAACGSRVISSVRHTRVRGSGRISLHSFGRAVDVQGNPSCIYARLHGWAGGYSVDYAAVNHVHISYSPDGREWGARFHHYGHGHRYAKRYRHHRRYARA